MLLKSSVVLRKLSSKPSPLAGRLLSSSSITTIKDQQHPLGLYYHSGVPEGQISLSFLKIPPPDASSSTIIGTVSVSDPSLASFSSNPVFLKSLHNSIRKSLRKGEDEDLVNEALGRVEGWIHVLDRRVFFDEEEDVKEDGDGAIGSKNPNRVGDSRDLIGSVFVKEGKINHTTYEPMPSYSVCTSSGILTLSPSLHKRLVKELGEELEVELQNVQNEI